MCNVLYTVRYTNVHFQKNLRDKHSLFVVVCVKILNKSLCPQQTEENNPIAGTKRYYKLRITLKSEKLRFELHTKLLLHVPYPLRALVILIAIPASSW